MGLRIKLNLAMLAALLAGLALAAFFVEDISEREARRAMLAEANVMMGAVNATIHYTDSQVFPLLSSQMKAQFLPQSIPFFAADQTFGRLATEFPGYSLRQPTTNPLNPADRPTPWEADVIKALSDEPKQDQLVLERMTDSGKVLSFAQPIRVNSEGCLACHSTPEAAPPSMVDIYGRNSGFHWKLGDLVGAEIVSVPEAVPLSRARSTTIAIVAGLAGVFVLLLILLNLLLHVFVIAPVRRLSKAADAVSLGKPAAGDLPGASPDEIGALAVSFARMRRSLTAAMAMLNG